MWLVPLIATALAVIALVGTVSLIRGIMCPPRKTYAKALGRGEPTDPAELNWQAKEHTFALADGAHSPGWIIAGQKADGPVVVIVHGFGDSRFGALTWVHLVREFASRIVVFDLPGHGDAQAKYSHGGMREPADVLAVIDQAAGPQGAVLFGYSLGAQIAIAVAADDARSPGPSRVLAVIADGPYRYWQEPIVRLLRAQRYPRQPFIFFAGLFFRLTAPGFADFDRAAKAAAMTCPLLVLHGREDELCPFQAGKAIADAAHDATFVPFDGGHHLDLASVDPVRYREALTQYFDRLKSHAPAAARQTPHRNQP